MWGIPLQLVVHFVKLVYGQMVLSMCLGWFTVFEWAHLCILMHDVLLDHTSNRVLPCKYPSWGIGSCNGLLHHSGNMLPLFSHSVERLKSWSPVP